MTDPRGDGSSPDPRARLLHDREAFRRWNEEMAHRYDPDAYHHHPNRLVRAVERMRVRRLLALLDAAPGHRVLEVGCGAGNILAELPDTARSGLDLSPWLLEKARARLGPAVDLREGWAEDLPYPDASFDRVYSSEVLEHVADPAAVLREMRRVVTPDGRVVVSFPNEALIDRVKDVLVATRLWRFFSNARGEGYAAAERMQDEWHLHALSVAAVREMARGFLRVETVAGVPTSVLALRHVVALRPA